MGEWKINLKNFCLACFDKTQNLLKEFYPKKIKFDVYKVSNWKVKIKNKRHLNFYREKILDEMDFGFKLTCRLARLGYGFELESDSWKNISFDTLFVINLNKFSLDDNKN
jgi:hypothetical protein